MTKKPGQAGGAARRGDPPKARPAKAASKPTRPRASSPGAGAKKQGRHGAAPRKPERPRAARSVGKGQSRAQAKGRLDQTLPPERPSVDALSEEDAIRSAKYLPRDLPRRLFEEERFLFPESYGVNRVRLLVKDPEWLFAYWDVNPASLADLARGLGERARDLSRLTLRVTDPVHGGSTDILLPPGARWWYLRGDAAPRSYRAELGVTLPSGEFRKLAESNTVVTPRGGPSAEGATAWVTYEEAQAHPPGVPAVGLGDLRPPAEVVGPWAPSPSRSPGREGPGERAGSAADAHPLGGASDIFRR